MPDSAAVTDEVEATGPSTDPSTPTKPKRRWLRWTLGVVGSVLFLSVLTAGGVLYVLTVRTPGEIFDSNGVPIYYTVEGEGEPVILIHGLGANADWNWRYPGVHDQLVEDFQVISMDCRGHGLSGKPTEVDMYGQEMAYDVIRLMDHLGIERAHLVGYSMGGFITLGILTGAPERVRSASIIAAGWKDPEDEEDLRSPYRDPPPVAYPVRPASMFPDAMIKDSIDFFRDLVGKYFIDVSALKLVRKSFRDVPVTAEQVAAIDRPTLCVIGTQDGLLPYALALYAQAPQVELMLVDGSGHLTLAANPKFRDRLHAFLLAQQGNPERIAQAD